MQDIEDEKNNSDKVLVLPLNEDSKKVTQALSNEKALKMLEMLADKPMSATSISEKMGLPLTTVKYNIDSLIEADLIKVKETKWSQKGREIKIYEPVQKLIVVMPGTKNVDRSSVIGMLKKYLGLFIGAVFAATGIEYLTRRMGLYPSVSSYPMIIDKASMKSVEYGGLINRSMDYGTGVANQASPVNVTSPMMATMVSNNTEDALILGSGKAINATQTIYPENATTKYLGTTGLNTTDINSTLAPLPYQRAENATILTNATPGLIPPDLLDHMSVWFFFGCIFIIIFMLIREIYYRKKTV